MKNTSTTTYRTFDLGVIVNCVLCALLLSTAGVGFVHIKNQQHAIGSLTREAEQNLREIRAYNKVLRTEINRLSSHARISSTVSQGLVALVPISGSALARLGQPVLEMETAQLRTATAATVGDSTP
jgi:hypothetical protein